MKTGRNNYNGTKCWKGPLRETTLSAGNALRFAILVLRAYTEIHTNPRVDDSQQAESKISRYAACECVELLLGVKLHAWRKGASKQKGWFQDRTSILIGYSHTRVCAATPQCFCLASFELFCSSLLLPVLRQPGLCIFKTHYVSLALGWCLSLCGHSVVLKMFLH